MPATKNNKVILFEAATKQKRSIAVAKKKTEGIHITAAVGKRIVLSFLSARKTSHKAAVHKEIEARGIQYEGSLNKMKWFPTIELLKRHELTILATRPGGASLGGAAMTWKDIKDIIPQTAELKSLLTEQNQWQANKRKRK